MVQGSLPGTLNPNPVRETKGLGFGLPPPPSEHKTQRKHKTGSKAGAAAIAYVLEVSN